MIELIGFIAGLAITGWLIRELIRFARKTWKEGRVVAWPLFTYLWGLVITLPLGLLGTLSKLDKSEPLLLMVGLAGGLPFLVFHLSSWALVVLWLVIVVNHGVRQVRTKMADSK